MSKERNTSAARFTRHLSEKEHAVKCELLGSIFPENFQLQKMSNYKVNEAVLLITTKEFIVGNYTHLVISNDTTSGLNQQKVEPNMGTLGTYLPLKPAISGV